MPEENSGFKVPTEVVSAERVVSKVAASSFVIVIVYIPVEASSAVTVIVITFEPAVNGTSDPVEYSVDRLAITKLEVEAATVGVTVISVTELNTDDVYVVIAGSKSSVRVAPVISRDDNVVSEFSVCASPQKGIENKDNRNKDIRNFKKILYPNVLEKLNFII